MPPLENHLSDFVYVFLVQHQDSIRTNTYLYFCVFKTISMHVLLAGKYGLF